MRTFEFTQPAEDGSAETLEIIRMTEEEIFDEYWPWWKELMTDKYGEGHYLIQPEVFIEDWVTTHWAVEIK